MTDELPESGEELIDETGRNPTQRRIDEGDEERPADASWEPERYGELPSDDEPENEPSPHEGEEGQAGDVA